MTQDKKPEDISIDDLKYLGSDEFIMWALTSGVQVDGMDVEFENHRYLIPIYMNNEKHIVWQKAAQLGATVYMLLRALWWLEQNQGRKAGLYFPTQEGVQNLSKDRLSPLIDSCPSIKSISTDGDKLGLRKIGKSSFYLYHLGGVASKDSVPLDFVSFDEVRLCNSRDIDQALHRLSSAHLRGTGFKTFMSTCFTGDTKVIVREKATGFVTHKSMRELAGCFRHYQALSYNRLGGYRARWRDITAVHNNGYKKVVEATFEGGHKVVCTPDHKFAYSTPNTPLFGASVFTPLNKIQCHRSGHTAPETGVYALTHVPTFTGGSYDLTTYEFFGLYVAEGTYTNGTVSIWQSVDGEKHQAVRDLAKDWADRNGLSWIENEQGVHISGLTSRPDLVELIRDCGKSAPTKCIPPALLNANKTQATHLLHGFILGDGHTPADSNREFDLFTTSPQLAEDLELICFKVGKPVQRAVRFREQAVVIDGVKTGQSRHPEIRLTHNSESHRMSEIIRDVGKLALRSTEQLEVEQEVFDLSIDQDAWYFLSSGGLLAKNCGMPDNDINLRFQHGSQHIWLSKCGCPDGCDLARTFPACVVTDDPKRPGELYLRCPKCRWIIKDPQNGRYVAHNPGADYTSFHVSQLVSKGRTLKNLWREYLYTTNKEEFYNAALGVPYIDGANRGVTPSMLQQTVDTNLRWAKDDISSSDRKDIPRTAMGVDQGGGYCMVVIADIDPDGTRKRIRHVEIVEQYNPEYKKSGSEVSPFERLYEIMDEYNVGICVVDMMPNYNDALKFAQSFPGRVFLAYYQREGKEVVQWGDRGNAKASVRKSGPLLKFKYQAALGRFPSMSFALGEWAEGNVKMPDLDGIRQMAGEELDGGRMTGHMVPQSPARRLFSHLPRLIKRWKETDAETGTGRWEWIYSGGDPHLAHAWNYCNVALERLRRKTIYTFG